MSTKGFFRVHTLEAAIPLVECALKPAVSLVKGPPPDGAVANTYTFRVEAASPTITRFCRNSRTRLLVFARV